ARGMTDPVRVGVFGAGGRMGAAVCEAVAGDAALQLVAAVDPFHVGLDVREVTGVDVGGLHVSGERDAFTHARAQVAVDFTVIDAARENAAWCGDNGVHVVVGTSGFDDASIGMLRERFTRSNCLIVPNFAIGAVLMMRFAELAAP